MWMRVRASRLNVRATPGTNGTVIGQLQAGMLVEVQPHDQTWGRITATVDHTTAKLTGFVMLSWLEAASTNQTGFKLGVNSLDNQMYWDAARRGCRYFLLMNNFAGAAQLKQAYPDAVVMVRRYWPQNFYLTAEQVINGLEGGSNPNLIYTIFNEADQGGQDGDALRQRASVELEVARTLKQRHGSTVAVGSFSMGCPDFTSPETVRIFQEMYAPAYNSGLIAIDMHLYSPNPQHIDRIDEWRWFERRWEWLFTRCGFDPTIRAVYCGECGLDQGGVGGFKAHGFTGAEVITHCNKLIALQNRQLVVGGKSYPSPIVGGALFCLGDNGSGRWNGYRVDEYLEDLNRVWSR